MELRARVAEMTSSTNGLLYDANFDPEVNDALHEAADLCWEYNQLRPSDAARRDELVDELLGSHGANTRLVQPFYCDYGANIHVGDEFFANRGTYILDGGRVTFGNNVFIAPYCTFSTAGHPVNAELRNEGLEYALPITVGDDVWFGAGVVVCPGVTIGSNVVIGAGSVVVKDIPSGVVAVGNPCRPMREITDADKRAHERFVPQK